ncbi:MAG TPA: rod shape-determining protein MreD [Gaiellaceae bacterium]
MIVDALKAGALLLLAALVQVSITSNIQVASGHPDLLLVLVVSVALLRGPAFGAAAGFWAGLVIDVASFQTLGLTSLLLTLAGYFAGRLGEVTKKSSPHPALIAVTIGTIGVELGSAVLYFMLGETVSAAEFFAGMLLPTLALNLLFAYPLFRLCRRIFPVSPRERREVVPVV